MKTTRISNLLLPHLMALFLGCASTSFSAATGYYSLTVEPGITTFANSLDQKSNLLSAILPSPPEETAVYKFDRGTGNYIVAWWDGFGWIDDMTLSPGDGAFIFTPSGFTRTSVGEVRINAIAPRPPPGTYLLGALNPWTANFEDAVGFPPAIGDRVLFYNGVYTNFPVPPLPASGVHTFGIGGWDSPPQFRPGKAFWLEANHPAAIDPNEVRYCLGPGLGDPDGAAVVSVPGGTNSFAFSLINYGSYPLAGISVAARDSAGLLPITDVRFDHRDVFSRLYATTAVTRLPDATTATLFPALGQQRRGDVRVNFGRQVQGSATVLVMHSEPTAMPVLNMEPMGPEAIALRWPLGPFSLGSSENLGSNWVSVEMPTRLIESGHELILPTLGERAFFHLRRDSVSQPNYPAREICAASGSCNLTQRVEESISSNLAAMVEFKQTLGNYQGASGSLLARWLRESPSRLNRFAEAERRAQSMLQGVAGQGGPLDPPNPGTGTGDPLEDLRQLLGDDEFAKYLRENKRQRGNYQGICGFGIVTMNPWERNRFEREEQRLADWLNNYTWSNPINPPPDTSELPGFLDERRRSMGDKAFAKWLEEHKRRYGNYQGICGYALVTMSPFERDRFRATEQQIDDWLQRYKQQAGIQPKNIPDFFKSLLEHLGPDEFLEMLKGNKRKWGNYQGICGSGVMDMSRNYPEAYRNFLETERQLEKWVQDQTAEKHSFVNPYGAGQDTASTTNQVELKDDRARRAFEASGVEALRPLTLTVAGRSIGVTQIDGQYVATETVQYLTDPETGATVEMWDFTNPIILAGELWKPFYILSLGLDNPFNLIRRTWESTETLGREFLDAQFAEMAANGTPVRHIELSVQALVVLKMTMQFQDVALPQLGDHVRAAQTHLDQFATAIESGDWGAALEHWEAAQLEISLAALEVLPMPAGRASKVVRRLDRGADLISDGARYLDETADAFRSAARRTTDPQLASRLSQSANQIQEMGTTANRVRNATRFSAPRPFDFAVAARDRAALEAQFGRGNVAQVGLRDGENVLVVTGPTSQKQVWVRPEYSSYKAAYEEALGVKVGSDFNVDHLQSRTRGAQQGYGYVRLEKVDARVNQDWGSRLEGRTVQLPTEPTGIPAIRNIDQFQWWKLQGIGPREIFNWLTSHR